MTNLKTDQKLNFIQTNLTCLKVTIADTAIDCMSKKSFLAYGAPGTKTTNYSQWKTSHVTE